MLVNIGDLLIWDVTGCKLRVVEILYKKKTVDEYCVIRVEHIGHCYFNSDKTRHLEPLELASINSCFRRGDPFEEFVLKTLEEHDRNTAATRD